MFVYTNRCLLEKSANIWQFDEFGENIDHSILTAGVREASFLQLVDAFFKIKEVCETLLICKAI